jgi:Thiamine monophosphate kinase
MAEFSIIDTYFNRQNINSVDLGVGDDSALLTPPPQQQLVICADTLIAGRHFPLDTNPHAMAGNLLPSISLILLQWAPNRIVFYWH